MSEVFDIKTLRWCDGGDVLTNLICT